MAIRKLKYPFTLLFVLIFSLGFHFVRFFMPAATTTPVRAAHCLMYAAGVNSDQQLPTRRNLKIRVEEDANALENHEQHLQTSSVSFFFLSQFALLARMHSEKTLSATYFLYDHHSPDDPLFIRNCVLII